MIRRKGAQLLLRGLAVLVLFLLALGVAEPLILGSDYLFSVIPLFLLLLYCTPLFLRSLSTANTERRRLLPATGSVQVSSRVAITSGAANELYIRIGPAGPWTRTLMAVCPVGFATVPGWIAWAEIVDPLSVWALPALALIVAFTLWLAAAHLAMNLLQCFWGTTHLTLTGDSIWQTVDWRKRRWIERRYRLGPDASVRNDSWLGFGVMVRGVRGEPALPWWKSLLLLRAPAHVISFGASLQDNDAQAIADSIEGYLRCRRTGREDAQEIQAEPAAAG